MVFRVDDLLAKLLTCSTIAKVATVQTTASNRDGNTLVTNTKLWMERVLNAHNRSILQASYYAREHHMNSSATLRVYETDFGYVI